MEGTLDVLFNGLVVHRFRDFSPAIRADVVTLLSEWAQASKIFRQNKYEQRLFDASFRFMFHGDADMLGSLCLHRYLKYVVWLLNDRDNIVRLAALTSLNALIRVCALVLMCFHVANGCESRGFWCAAGVRRGVDTPC